MSKPQKLRCAVYTRKSSQEGLEQDFNSLDAQRESGVSYIQSQKHENWSLFQKQYNDGGFSGGTMDRPALKSLISDIKRSLIDVVVVYKVDRLSRSLHDFAKLVELFDEHGVTFVSVTQSFNTKDSMGRLTLNMLLSFAQFEREVTGERIRDKIAASRKKGIWMGGTPPIGYDVVDRKLIVNEAEAETVRYIFEGYLKCKSVIGLINQLKVKGITSKSWLTQTGNYRKGTSYDRGKLYKLLHNRIYIGEAVHKDESYPGEHNAIISNELWQDVQNKLDKNNSNKDSNRHKSYALLKGLIFDREGNTFSPTYSAKTNKTTGAKTRTYYYVNQKAMKHGAKHCDVTRIRRDDIEVIAIDRLKKICTSPEQKDLLENWSDKVYVEKRKSLKLLIDKIILTPEHIKIYLRTFDSIAQIFEDIVPYKFRRYGGKKLIVDQDGNKITPEKTNKDEALIKALVRAHKWGRLLEEGKSTKEIIENEDVSERYVLQIVPLRYLAPDIQDHIMYGTQSYRLNMQALKKPIPLCWDSQRTLYT